MFLLTECVLICVLKILCLTFELEWLWNSSFDSESCTKLLLLPAQHKSSLNQSWIKKQKDSNVLVDRMCPHLCFWRFFAWLWSWSGCGILHLTLSLAPNSWLIQHSTNLHWNSSRSRTREMPMFLLTECVLICVLKILHLTLVLEWLWKSSFDSESCTKFLANPSTAQIFTESVMDQEAKWFQCSCWQNVSSFVILKILHLTLVLEWLWKSPFDSESCIKLMANPSMAQIFTESVMDQEAERFPCSCWQNVSSFVFSEDSCLTLELEWLWNSSFDSESCTKFLANPSTAQIFTESVMDEEAKWFQCSCWQNVSSTLILMDSSPDSGAGVVVEVFIWLWVLHQIPG